MQIIPIFIEKEIESSDDIADLIISNTDIVDGDILVVTQKIISKQEDRIIDLSTVQPSLLASGIASQYGKDPRIVELILSESKRIVKMRDGVIIVETRSGLVCANAGVDESNVMNNHAALLPINPDNSARMICSRIKEKINKNIPVIISDTFGRPFRMGQTDCAIGVFGLNPILDYAGSHDTFGKTLRVTVIAVADELASSAELVMKKTLKCPIVIIRGYRFDDSGDSSAKLLRPEDEDLFR